MRTAEMEVVRYDAEDIIHTSNEFIDTYAQQFSDEYVLLGDRVKEALASIVLNDKSDSIEWKTPGLNIYFSGYPPILPRMIDNQLVYVAREPHFTLEEGVERELQASREKHVRRVKEALIDKMITSPYEMELEEDEILLYLKFPKDKYAQSIELHKVPIIE